MLLYVYPTVHNHSSQQTTLPATLMRNRCSQTESSYMSCYKTYIPYYTNTHTFLIPFVIKEAEYSQCTSSYPSQSLFVLDPISSNLLRNSPYLSLPIASTLSHLKTQNHNTPFSHIPSIITLSPPLHSQTFQSNFLSLFCWGSSHFPATLQATWIWWHTHPSPKWLLLRWPLTYFHIAKRHGHFPDLFLKWLTGRILHYQQPLHLWRIHFDIWQN